MFSLQKTNVLPLCTAKRLGQLAPHFWAINLWTPNCGKHQVLHGSLWPIPPRPQLVFAETGQFWSPKLCSLLGSWPYPIALFSSPPRVSREKQGASTHPGLPPQAADPSEQPALRVDWRRIPSSEITGRNHWSHWDGRQSIGYLGMVSLTIHRLL